MEAQTKRRGVIVRCIDSVILKYYFLVEEVSFYEGDLEPCFVGDDDPESNAGAIVVGLVGVFLLSAKCVTTGGLEIMCNAPRMDPPSRKARVPSD